MKMLSKPVFTRRQFNHLASSFATLAVADSARGNRPAEFSLNYILGSPMYGTAPLHEVLSEARKTGATAIDIWPQRHANHREQMDALGFDRVHKLLEENNVQLGMITRYDLGPDRIVEELPVLREFQAKLLVCGAKDTKGDTLKERVREFVEGMKPYVEKAEKDGVKIGIENHSGSLLSSPDAIRYFVEFAKSPYLGLALAPYHLPQDPKLIAELVKDVGESLVFFQAWQHGKGCMEKLPKEDEMLQMPGRGSLDFIPILRALSEIGYKGWTEVFMHPVPRGIPIRDSSEEVTGEINRSRMYLDQCVRRN